MCFYINFFLLVSSKIVNTILIFCLVNVLDVFMQSLIKMVTVETLFSIDGQNVQIRILISIEETLFLKLFIGLSFLLTFGFLPFNLLNFRSHYNGFWEKVALKIVVMVLIWYSQSFHHYDIHCFLCYTLWRLDFI